jgi:2-amino-4-hydroxy-6-hydroxymethyldihydropteridine diphosphokinase
MQSSFDCYIGIGSNLHQPMQQITAALDLLQTLPHTSLIKTSHLYQNPAMLAEENTTPQPDYINAVAWIQTTLEPELLLKHLQTLETQQGRQRTEKIWSSRTLDLDVLLYGDLKIDSPSLTIPHKGLLERAFVLIPLCDCNPDLILPNGKVVKDFISDDMKQQLTRI